jgi:transcriptional regulator with XRE-family HTH domain
MKLDGPGIVERIDRLLASRKKKRQALASDLGFSAANIAKWKTQGSVPSSDAAVAIADYLGVSVRWLLTGKDEQGLDRDEWNLLVKYRSLDDQGRYEVRALLDAKLAVREEEAPDPGLKQVT